MEKYKKSYVISSFEVDAQSRLRLHSLFNLFQDIADEHAEKIGVGYTFCKQNGVGWVGGAYRLKINRLPTWGESVTLETWPSASTAASGIRDFRLTDKNGQDLVLATSQWVLVDTNRMRPIPVAKHLPHYEVIDEHTVPPDFIKIPAPEGQAEVKPFTIHADDIDLNDHVNNALYPTWALDSFSDEYLKTHQITDIQIDFKRPAKYGYKIALQTIIKDLSSTTLIVNPDEGTEYARVHIGWRE